MIAHAVLAVEAPATGGRPRCTELRSDPPLTLRETPGGVHLVASGAGPVGGDELALTVRVGAGAALDVRSVAASMVHPGPSGRPSQLVTDVEVDVAGRLRWTPEPAILVRGCDHRATTRVRLAAGAALVWREEVVLGRHGEGTGSVLARLVVDGPDGPLLRTDLAVGPRWPGSLGPGGVGEGRAAGSLLVVHPDAGALLAAAEEPVAAPGGAVRWAASPLSAPGAVLVTAVAAGAGALRDRFDALAARVGGWAGDAVTTW